MSQSIRIVIGALGGEGGGVLGKWIADMAAREGYLSQTTSVPGVAQRTGATIYYIELFPRSESEQAGKQPVMSMFPTPGDVDIVICSEIVEAGRLIQRGFVTPDRTTLISSTHRTYGITEKEALGSGIVDKDAIEQVAKASAKTYIGFDMLATARKYDSVINAALFGALAETEVLPFSRASFEETIRLGKIAVESNLKTFDASFILAQQQSSGGVAEFTPPPVAPSLNYALPAATTAEGAQLLTRIANFPAICHEMIYLAVSKLVNYQNFAYANYYLDRLQVIAALDQSEERELTRETARYLGLWMAYEDLPRVAQIKIRRERFARFREEVKARDGQQVAMVEFLHPRVEEFCGVMPVSLGKFCQNSKLISRFLGLFAGPRNVRTNGVWGYLSFYCIAQLRRIRPYSLINQIEQANIEQWLQAVASTSARDTEAALEVARCGRLIKGYGSTRERGNHSMQVILDLLSTVATLPAESLTALREAALEDEKGKTLTQLAQQLRGA